MAGPSLSHILEPRPESRSDVYLSPSPSLAHRGEGHYQSQQHHRSPPHTGSNLPAHAILKPPHAASSTTSTLQVRPGPGPGSDISPRGSPISLLASGPTPTLPPIAASTPPSTAYWNSHHEHKRGPSLSPNHIYEHTPGPTHGKSHSESRVSPAALSSTTGIASSVTSPATPAAVPATGSASAPATSNSTPASQSNHRGNNLYACRDCGRSYSRPEHLVRHVQTHTLGRRFVCDICQKSFARKDLLRRHVANHDNDSPKKRRRTTTSPGAGRVSHACRSCAVARVKCDDTKPCKRCVSRKLTCVSTETPSTAAMHLMHFSANAHANVGSSNESNKANSDGDKSTTAHSVASMDSHSPGSFPHSHQPRSPVLPAPHSVAPEDPAAGSFNKKSLPLAQSHLKQLVYEHSHVPTPKTSVEQGPNYSESTPPPELEPSTSAMDPDRLPFADFLRHVLYEGGAADPGKTSPIQGLIALDFCDNSSLDLIDGDFGLLDKWNAEDITQTRRDLVKIWTNSPYSRDSDASDAGSSDQRNSRLSPGSSEKWQGRREQFSMISHQKLDQSSRDRALVIVLGASRQLIISNRLASSFPSLDLMDVLVSSFLSNLANQPSEWIHLPTFGLNTQPHEWIAIAAASGAVTSPIPGLRRFGFALQEAVLATIPTRLDAGHGPDQDLALIQSLIIGQDIGLWSGNRRKMEFAEGHLSIPVTMMRYRKKLHKSSYPVIALEPSDEGAVLTQKWQKWVSQEKWKRLVFHCFLQNAQCSMATLTSPAMSYSELALPLPEPSELWLAKSASEWKTLYLAKNSGTAERVPAIGDLFRDAHLLPSNKSRVDVQFSISIYLHAFWALILEFQQLSAVHKSRSSTGSSMTGSQSVLLGSRHQELVKELQHFRQVSSEWSDMTPREHMVLNLLMMNLHVSMDDVQLFAGKEGEEQALRIYPVLQQWASCAEGRSATWYAGQVLRHAKLSPPGQLKDFYAVAVHHAALVLWTYGVIAKANRRQTPLPTQHVLEPINLDGPDPMPVQRFINFGQGRPVIRGVIGRDSTDGSPIENPREAMDVAQEVLRLNLDPGSETVPPIVENLCFLIKQLGDAAWTVGLG